MKIQHTRLVTNKFLVSLNISINFSASTSHSLSEFISPAKIPGQISFSLRYPFITSFSFSASNSLNCTGVKRFWTRAFDLGAALSSENNEVLEGLTVSSVWFATFTFPRFLRESMTAFILGKIRIEERKINYLRKLDQEPFAAHPLFHKSQPISSPHRY